MFNQAITLLKLAILVLTLASNSHDPVLKQQAIQQANSAIQYANSIINVQTPTVKAIPVESTTTPSSTDILLQTRPGWKVFNPENVQYPSCVTDGKSVQCGG